MYDVNDILARLQNGESADAIAQSFADALNEAITSQKAKEEEMRAAKLAEAKREAKISALTNIIDDILDFIETFYPEVLDGTDIEMTAEDIETLVDELDKSMEQAKELTALMKRFADMDASAVATKQPSPNPAVAKLKKTVTPEDAIMSFLANNNLI